MRILFFNVGYCTGLRGNAWGYLGQSGRYLAAPKKVFQQLNRFLASVDADVVALAEVDSGSFRSRGNHVAALAGALRFESVLYKTKYAANGILRTLPIFRHQCNAIFAKASEVPFAVSYFRHGVKRVVLRAAITPRIDLFVVHLSLGYRTRRRQINELSEMLRASAGKEIILVGDFNAFRGPDELDILLRRNQLQSVNVQNLPTYPSRHPARELDFVFVSSGIHVKQFDVLPTDISDHLPILLEIA